jgi:hypothetical protein
MSTGNFGEYWLKGVQIVTVILNDMIGKRVDRYLQLGAVFNINLFSSEISLLQGKIDLINN